MTLLRRLENERAQQREILRVDAIARLRAALAEVASGEPVIVFGSVVKPGKFHAGSDVDVAFEEEPRRVSIYGMHSLLAERLGRPVDVLSCEGRDRQGAATFSCFL